MSKGLGRGLSSLFAVYDQKDEQKTIKSDEKVEKNNDFSQKNEVLESDVLNQADNLLEKYQKKPTPQPKPEDINFLKDKENLEQRLKQADEDLRNNATKNLPISKIVQNPDQPRKSFDQESLKELAQSIKEHGIIQPIIVVQKGENYQIIAGERRYRASKLAGLTQIPAIIRNYDERQIKEIALIENLQREDLNPIETAVAIKQLIDTYGLTQEEIAQKIGKSRPLITNTLRLLNLEPEVLTLVEKGKLSPGAAKVLVTLPREQQIDLAKRACDGKMTSREVEKEAQELHNPAIAEAKKNKTLSIELMSIRDEMQQVFGTKVTILGNSKKGRIYLDYYNQDDLDRIYSLINKLK